MKPKIYKAEFSQYFEIKLFTTPVNMFNRREMKI